MLNDPLRSARIRMDSQQEQQLICKRLIKARLVIHDDQQNHTIRKHTSKESRQRRGGAKPLRAPRIMSDVLWGYPLTPLTQPVTSIGSILTLPKLHFATFTKIDFNSPSIFFTWFHYVLYIIVFNVFLHHSISICTDIISSYSSDTWDFQSISNRTETRCC